MNHTTLDTLKRRIFSLLILLAPFSLVPSVSIEHLGYAGLRIGGYQLLAGIFILLCLSGIWLNRHKALGSRIGTFYIVSLALILLSSLMRAISMTRSIVMAASVMFLVTLTLSAWVYVREIKFDIESIRKNMLIGGFLYSLATIIQLVVATYTTKHALLCVGCMPDVFGFPRMNVFAVEPQFWANALLPFLFVAYDAVYKKVTRTSVVSLVMVSLAIGLTFSRGAFFAIASATIFYLIVQKLKDRFSIKGLFVSMGSVFFGIIVAFCLLITSASIRYSNTEQIAYKTLKGMVEHLSLGRIELPERTHTASSTINIAQSIQGNIKSSSEENFESQGLVEASQNDRLKPADLALRAVRNSPVNYIVGVGLGNFAPYVRQNIDNNVSPALTVYIFYVLLFAEAGLLGLMLFVGAFSIALWRLVSRSRQDDILVATVLIAFLVQYVFFGSYINVTYIWLWLGIGLGIGVELSHKHVKSNKTKRRTVPQI